MNISKIDIIYSDVFDRLDPVIKQSYEYYKLVKLQNSIENIPNLFCRYKYVTSIEVSYIYPIGLYKENNEYILIYLINNHIGSILSYDIREMSLTWAIGHMSLSDSQNCLILDQEYALCNQLALNKLKKFFKQIA